MIIFPNNRLQMPIAIATLLLINTFYSGQAYAQAGKVSAVNVAASGTPPGSRTRTLMLGANVVERERIVTDARGSAQIMFTDRGSMSIGANSTVVIDRFVFSGGTLGGTMAATMTRGALRFVGGQVSHTTGATVQTPVATIGVRGGVVTIVLEGEGAAQRLRVINHFGRATITNGAGRFELMRGGFQSIIGNPNMPPVDGGRIDQGQLKQIMARLTSQPGQTGGSPNPPSNESGARNRIGRSRIAVQTPAIHPHAAADNIARSARQPERDYHHCSSYCYPDTPHLPTSPDTPVTPNPPITSPGGSSAVIGE